MLPFNKLRRNHNLGYVQEVEIERCAKAENGVLKTERKKKSSVLIIASHLFAID
jgi:hypothetical protein